jgi:hypothetical protein
MDWIRGLKHARTPPAVFKNAKQWDLLRAINKRRCQICDATISSNQFEIKEIMFECSENRCSCSKPYPSLINLHEVCEVCDAMYRALYVNYGMKNQNYFKNLDNEDKANRQRMGL